MKRIFYVFVIFVLMLPMSVLASGSIKINKYDVKLNPGVSTNFKITATNATGEITVSSSDSSVASVDNTHFWIDNETVTVNIKANKVGSAVINVKVNGGDYDEVEIKTTYKIVVYVNELTTTTTTTKRVEVAPTTKKVTTIKTTKQQTTTQAENTTQTTTIPIETTTTTEIVKEKKPLIRNLKIVGFDFGFNSNQTSYKIEIPKNLNEIYVISEKDDGVSFNDGIIDIKDKDKVELTAVDSVNHETITYTISFDRKDYEELKKEKNENLFIYVLILVIFIVILIIINFILKKIKRKRELDSINSNNGEDELEYKNDYFE